jgi:hypothetical protein
MLSRYFALVAGVVYLVIGVLGFLPGIVQSPIPDMPPMDVDSGYGLLLGLFPINVLHNVVHLLVGLIGLISNRTVHSARNFSRGLAIFYGLLTVMGLIPGLNTTFGLIPIFSNDVWLHALTALVAAYFGWLAPVESRGTRPVYTVRTDAPPRM